MSPRLFLLCLLAAGAGRAAQDDLLVCGWDEVYILNVATGAKSFSWKEAERPELPDAYKTKYRTTDDCKAVSGGRVLITASSDGVALVDRKSGKTTFWGACANAHSADLLPGDRIAVACSTRDTGGNRLAIFDGSVPERELYSTELYSGHGAHWDAKRKLLWALGNTELRSYELVDWESKRKRRTSKVASRTLNWPPDACGSRSSRTPRTGAVCAPSSAGASNSTPQ
jgi:hypothetical protein